MTPAALASAMPCAVSLQELQVLTLASAAGAVLLVVWLWVVKLEDDDQ